MRVGVGFLTILLLASAPALADGVECTDERTSFGEAGEYVDSRCEGGGEFNGGRIEGKSRERSLHLIAPLSLVGVYSPYAHIRYGAQDSNQTDAEGQRVGRDWDYIQLYADTGGEYVALTTNNDAAGGDVPCAQTTDATLTLNKYTLLGTHAHQETYLATSRGQGPIPCLPALPTVP